MKKVFQYTRVTTIIQSSKVSCCRRWVEGDGLVTRCGMAPAKLLPGISEMLQFRSTNLQSFTLLRFPPWRRLPLFPASWTAIHKSISAVTLTQIPSCMIASRAFEIILV